MKPRLATPEQLWKSYQELGTLQAVCRRHGYSSASVGIVSESLRAAGYQLHPQGASRATREYPIEDLQKLYARLGSYRKVAQQIGSTYDAVRMRLARANQGRS